MKITCDVKELKTALTKISGVVGLDKSQSILEYIKLKTSDKTLTLIATDTEIQIEKVINANIKKDGEVLVPGKRFCEFISKITCEKIDIEELDDGRVMIKYLDSSTYFPTRDIKDFPKLENIDVKQKFEIIMGDLKELIEKVDFSLSSDNNRPVLNGVFLEIEDGIIKAVALDGYRIAIATKPIKQKDIKTKILVHGKQIREIKKILDAHEDVISFIISENKIYIDLLHTKIICQLMKEEYINYKSVIPEGKTTEISVQKKEFEYSIQRADVINRESRSNDVTLVIKDSMMELNTKTLDGELNEKLPVKVTGVDQKVVLGVKYIMDCLKVIKEDVIIISISTSTKPVTIKNQDKTWEYVIVPILKR